MMGVVPLPTLRRTGHIEEARQFCFLFRIGLLPLPIASIFLRQQVGPTAVRSFGIADCGRGDMQQ